MERMKQVKHSGNENKLFGDLLGSVTIWK